MREGRGRGGRRGGEGEKEDRRGRAEGEEEKRAEETAGETIRLGGFQCNQEMTDSSF